MVGQNPSLTNSNNSSNVTEQEKQTFSMQKVFIFYIVQTALYVAFCKIPHLSEEM